MTALAMDSSDLVDHLLMDYAIKGGIVIVALILLVLGMVVVWRRAGRAKERPGRGR